MNYWRYIQFLLLAFLPALVAAESSLCATTEETIFSCLVGRKTLSVCASPKLTSSSGYLQYRFGSSREKIELRYPKEEAPPGGFFRHSEESAGARGGVSNLQFSIGSYRYTVYRFRHALSREYAGVAVKNREKVSYFKCGDAELIDNLRDLNSIGLPMVAPQDFIEGAE